MSVNLRLWTCSCDKCLEGSSALSSTLEKLLKLKRPGKACRCMGDSAEMRKIEMLTSEGRGGYFPVSGHTASTSCEYASLEVEQKEDRFLSSQIIELLHGTYGKQQVSPNSGVKNWVVGGDNLPIEEYNTKYPFFVKLITLYFHFHLFTSTVIPVTTSNKPSRSCYFCILFNKGMPTFIYTWFRLKKKKTAHLKILWQ